MGAGWPVACMMNLQHTWTWDWVKLLEMASNTVCRPSAPWHMHQHRSMCLFFSYPVQPVHRMWLNGSSGHYLHIPQTACAS